jgi:RHS repeat-associated protein
LASPYTAPQARGPLLAKVFPTYSPESGISEWGLGWQTDVALTRWRVRGDLDYKTDDITGVFGHCQKPAAGDGYWYPVGLNPAVRIQEVPGGFVAYDPDGRIWRFGQSARIVTPSGDYAWLLYEVESAIGEKTKLTYGETNPSGRLFLTRVEYGGRGDDFQYRIDISYSPLTQDFVDYRSNFPLHLDRRVTEIDIYAKNTSTGQMSLRWKYVPTYLSDPLGPAFFLFSVQQVFGSGDSPPPFTFHYQPASTTLQDTQLQPASKFDPVIAQYGGEIAFPDSSSTLDADMDGMVDLESAFDYTLIRQTKDGYVYESLGNPPSGARPECRGVPSHANRPRTLAQVRPSDSDYSVASLQYRASTLDTALLLCSREGLARHETTLPGDWTLGPTTRFVDLNRDHQPDLIRVYEGGYQVIPNVSTADAYGFGAMVQGNVDLHFPFQAFWVQDFNGDGMPDLIFRTGSFIAVYFGKGNYEFENEPQFFPVKDSSGQQVNLDNFQFTWLDANGDGLTDLLLSQPTAAFLYINTGSSLRATSVPSLSAVQHVNFPLFNDFVGSGNAEVFVVNDGKSYSVNLNEPGTSLLKTADDGRGTVLRFSYVRGPAAYGVRQRHALLDTLTVESSGHDAVSYHYTYDAPVLHTLGEFVLGYGHVSRRGATTTETLDFFNSDTTVGLLVASNQHDDNSPLVDSYTERAFQDVTSFGVTWKRLLTLRSGWKKPVTNEVLFEQTDFTQYEAEVCPSRIVNNNQNGVLTTDKTRSAVPNLAQSLHCLAGHIVLTGSHADKTFDFVHEGLFTRNDVGLVTKVQSLASTDAITLQEVVYNPDYTITSISSPGRGITSFVYQPGTLLLQQVTTPDQVIVRASDVDPVTDAIRTLRTDRGSTAYTQYFRFDGQERLANKWNDLGGASEQKPNQTLSYRYATNSTPASVLLSTLVDAPSGVASQSIEFATAAGESYATARHIPEGWTFDELTERNVSRRETNTYLRPTLAPDVDMLALAYPALLASAQQVASSLTSAFGHDVQSRLKFHADVEKQVVVSLELGTGELTQTALENSTFKTVGHLDAGKRMLAFDDEAGTRYSYRYDAMGRLREVVLPDGKHHRVAFDAHGRVGRLDREGVASVQYGYDTATHLMTQKLFLSTAGQPMRQVSFQYDAIGRKSLETHTDLLTAASQSYRYYYDGSTPENPADQTFRGLLTGATGDGYVKRFEFRPDGSLSRRKVSILGWRSIDTQLLYYEDGTTKEKRTTVQDNLGQPLTQSVQHYDRDNYGRLSSISLGGVPLATLGYDSNGRLIQANFVPSDPVHFSRDPLTRRLVGMNESDPRWSASNSQRMNARGVLASETISLNLLNLNRVYGYSPPGFLTSSIDEQTSYAYEFDPFGLPSSIQENADRRSFVAAGDTLAVGQVVYRFDVLGRTTQKGDLNFTYAPNGRLAQAQHGADVWSFIHDERGQRLAKRSSDGFMAGYFDEGYLDTAGLTEPFLVGGVTVGVIQLGTFKLLPMDVRGTVTGEPDGTLRASSPFGDRAVHPDISAAIDYVTKGFDADLGIVRMGVRDYDPSVSRFLTPDPLFLETPDACLNSPVECNLYGYARNIPTSFVDPTGLGAWDTIDEIANTAAKYGPPVGDYLFRVASEVVDVSGGVARGVAASISYGIVGAPQPTDSGLSRLGQTLGTAWVEFEGVNLTTGGAAATALGLAGTPLTAGASLSLDVAGAPAIVAGGYLAVGAGKNFSQLANAPMESRRLGGGNRGDGGSEGGGGRGTGSSARLTRPQQRQTAKYLGMEEVKGMESQGQPVFEKDGRYFSFSNTSHTAGEVFKELDRNTNRLGTTDLEFNRIGP